MTGIGSSDLARHLKGETLTIGQAVRAKCADCMGNYADGRQSCEMPECPLFPFHRYNPNRIRRSNPSRIGLRPGEVSADLAENDNVSEIVGDV